MSNTSNPSIVCLWCNGVMQWGRGDLWYDLCDRCIPFARHAVMLRLDEAPLPYEARAVVKAPLAPAREPAAIIPLRAHA